MMPRMNGEEFVQELSRRGRQAEFPIIILSADPRARLRSQAFRCG